MPKGDSLIPADFRDILNQHVRRYEQTGDCYSGPFAEQPTVVLATKGRRTGEVRQAPLVRVEHGGMCAVIRALAGAPNHPQ